jgi:hypothetical protein
MISCDYNGWNDAPEEERECLDQYSELSVGAEALHVPASPKGGRDLARAPGLPSADSRVPDLQRGPDRGQFDLIRSRSRPRSPRRGPGAAAPAR